MRVTDSRGIKKARTFRDLQVGDVFEKLIDGRPDGTVWIKVFAKDSSLDLEIYNAFILSDNLTPTENRFRYFNADTPVRKLNAELTILGEAEWK